MPILQAEPSDRAANDKNIGERSAVDVVARRKMIITPVQDQAITARMALIVGGTTFDRLFSGVRLDEVDGDILYVYAKNEETAAEMEDSFAVHIPSSLAGWNDLGG
jgi:hypothetical protein